MKKKKLTEQSSPKNIYNNLDLKSSINSKTQSMNNYLESNDHILLEMNYNSNREDNSNAKKNLGIQKRLNFEEDVFKDEKNISQQNIKDKIFESPHIINEQDDCNFNSQTQFQSSNQNQRQENLALPKGFQRLISLQAVQNQNQNRTKVKAEKKNRYLVNKYNDTIINSKDNTQKLSNNLNFGTYKIVQSRQNNSYQKFDDPGKQLEYLIERHEQLQVNEIYQNKRRGDLKLSLNEKQLYEVYLSILQGKQLQDNYQNLLSQFQTGHQIITQDIMKEEDYHLGDMIIQFANPDHPHNYNIVKPISHLQKQKIIEKSLNIIDPQNEKEIQQNQILMHAFYQVFEELQNYYTPEEQKQIQILKKEIQGLQVMVKKLKNNVSKKFNKDVVLNPENPVSPFFKLAQIQNREKNKKICTRGKFFVQEELDQQYLSNFSPKEQEFLQTQAPWKQTGNKTNDFFTLFRHFVWIQMARALKFELSDLLSLEPVDKSLRPYRLHPLLWQSTITEMEIQSKIRMDNNFKNQLQNYQVVSPKFQYLKNRIIQLIEEINFKKIARETNQSEINTHILEHGVTEITDFPKLSDQEWILYYDYLIYINEQCLKLRKKYQQNDELALEINRINDTRFKFTKIPKKSTIKKQIYDQQQHNLQVNKQENKQIDTNFQTQRSQGQYDDLVQKSHSIGRKQILRKISKSYRLFFPLIRRA
ncbi:hypothetical protein PPERSA_04184 [Pseudocohnilembus persalinus]|uniref:Uncharacterized protein n=1 Tax=Pseudocohnilembus persalinus TaxID=266149 RepID=A0A0V0QNS9_PSEPJ|nr:hypothetical protein PPERSA_04184 [Pseudocohnilembus persalinus]|eukprot:KRX03632.1 hypothetical protein PPERSA_04184 [Pseudocohnilembus persalinus]